MNQQQIFDKVITHLINQNEKSRGYARVDSSFGYMYYGSDNKKCAIGCLIPERIYHPSFELFTPKKLMNFGVIPDVENTDENIELLDILQDLHDCPVWDTFDQPMFFQAVRMKVNGFSGNLELPEVFLKAEARCHQ